jgi:signal transduction histidine kinase/ligand-binding sensor domain-containing protein/DNA-binding response OmpR family regulator
LSFFVKLQNQMFSKVRILIVCLVQFITLQGSAQLALNTVHYATENGLSDNRITVITKDRDGFMWFGSWAGISRFDGYQFKTFKSYPGDNSPLKSNRFDQIVEDGVGQYLWIGAYDRRIYRFDKKAGVFVSLAQLLGDSSLEQIAFSKILAVRGSEVWLKTEDSGILLLKNSASNKPEVTWFSHSLTRDHKISSNTFDFFHLDKHKNVWLASAGRVDLIALQPDGKYGVKNAKTSNGVVTTYFSESNNGIRVGTSNGELLHYNHSLQLVGRTAVSINGISHLAESSRSKLIYCTTTSGELFSVDEKNIVTKLFQTKDETLLSYIFEDSSRNLWIGSQRHGIIRFDNLKKQVDYFYPEKDYVISKGVKSFIAFEDRTGIVYLNFDGQISYYDARAKKLQLLSPKLSNYPRSKNVVRFYYDKTGVLWLSSGYEGIDKMVFQENPFTYSLPRPLSNERESNEVRGVFSDAKGILWLANKRGELFSSQAGKTVPPTFKKDFGDKTGVYFIMGAPSGQAWLATKGNGLFHGSLDELAKGQAKFSQYLPDPKNPDAISSTIIYCLLKDKAGNTWAGSYEQGLIRIDTVGEKIVFKTIFNSFKNYPKKEFNRIRHLATDKNGLIWIATTDGLLIFNPKSGSANNYVFKSYKKEAGNIKSLGGNDIQYIYPDSKGRVWVLTTTGGLNLAIGSNPMKSLSFQNYSTKNGLPSDFLLSCIEDRHQNLWIATQNGLSKMSADRASFQNFDQKDGLGSSNFSESSCARLSDGRLVFGTTTGLLSYNPDAIHSLKVSAPMVITNLQINSKDVEPGEESPLKDQVDYARNIRLNYDQNTLGFSFAVLDFHATDKHTYAYRLVGYDDVWRSTQGQRNISFTKLPPGNYTFQVKSTNHELYKQIPFRSLAIVIDPPFWKTWWAYASYLSIFAAAIILFRRNELTMLRLKQEIAVEQQVAELKVDFFNQISHELRTPLTMIISPSEEIQQNEALSQKGTEYIAVVLANARRMLHLVNQVLNLRKVQSGKESLVKGEVEIISIIKELIFSFKETIDKRHLTIELIAENNQLNGWVDRHKFEVIFYNLLGNAIKFSNDKGRILIELSKADRSGYFQLTIIDEGIGVKEEDLQKIFNLYFQGSHLPQTGIKGTGIGLALTKELVDLHEGRIWAGHNDPQGLKIMLELEQSPNSHAYQYIGAEIQDKELITPKNYQEEPSTKQPLPTLLIVEDNEDMQKFLKNKFSDSYKVLTASDGEEGLEMAKLGLPNLILSDVMMPKKDGIQLLDELKNNHTTSHIPVILLSAKFSIESQIEGLKYGADYYLAKPFNFTLLKAAVDTILVRRKQAFQEIQDKIEEVPEENVLTEYDRIFLSKLLEIVESSLNEPEFNIDDVAESLGMSRSAFYRKFKSLTDTAPIDFVRDTRLKKAKEIMDSGEDNISIVGYSVGFNSPKYFTMCFKKKYSQTPSEYLKSVRGKKNPQY